jgi:hypothetical protein
LKVGSTDPTVFLLLVGAVDPTSIRAKIEKMPGAGMDFFVTMFKEGAKALDNGGGRD